MTASFTALTPRLNDIQKETERSGKVIWWIAGDYLMTVLDGLKEETLWVRRHEYMDSVPPAKRHKTTLPDTGRAWRFKRENGRFYYAYDNIPDRAPANYRSRLEEPKTLFEIAKSAPKVDELAAFEADLKQRMDNVRTAFNPVYQGFSDAQRAKLTNAAAAMQAFLDIAELSVGLSESRSFCPLLRQFCAVVERNGWAYLPKNWRVMKLKVAEIMAGKPVGEVIDLPRKGNANAVKFDSEQMVNWLIYLRSLGQNWTDAEIIRKVTDTCDGYNIEPPSERWMQEKLNDPHVRWLTQTRYGSKGKHRQIFSGYVPIAGAVSAGDCWQMDGTRVNLLGWQVDGKARFLYVVFCRDMFSGAVLGWHFSLTEDGLAYHEALRMACRSTGYLPYELVTDRFPGHKSERWKSVVGKLEAYGVRVTLAKTATGKAQMERWIGSWQNLCLQRSPWYYGEGIQSKRKSAHRSGEYLAQAQKISRENGWNEDAARAEAERCVEMWNEMPQTQNRRLRASGQIAAPRIRHDRSEKPNVVALDGGQAARIFGETRLYQIRSGMICLETNLVKCFYPLPVEIVSRYTHVLVAFEPFSPETAWIFEGDSPNAENPKLLAEVERQLPMLATGPNAEWGKISAAKARIRRIEEERRSQILQIEQAINPDISILMGARVPKSEQELAETAATEQYITRPDESTPLKILSEKQEEIVHDEPTAPIHANHAWFNNMVMSQV